jgi:hypothetical protein
MAVDWAIMSSRVNCCKVAQGSGRIPKTNSKISQRWRFTMWEEAFLMPTEAIHSAGLIGAWEPIGVFLGHGVEAGCLNLCRV